MIRRSVFITSLILLVAVAASAQPIEWPVADGGNGHWYEFVPAPAIDWEAAQAAANVWNEGLSSWGYLMAIETAEENAWLLATLNPPDAWIALMQMLAQPPEPPCGNEPDLGWHWTTVAVPLPLAYTNWCPGQPDDNGNTECFLVPHEQHGMYNAGGCWSDEFGNFAGVQGYLVEYEIGVLDVESTNWSRIKALYQ